MKTNMNKKGKPLAFRLTGEEERKLEELAKFFGLPKSKMAVEAVSMIYDTMKAIESLKDSSETKEKLKKLLEEFLGFSPSGPGKTEEILARVFLERLKEQDPNGFAKRMGLFLMKLLS